MTTARQALEDQTRQASLTAQLSNAQEMLQNGRVDKALEQIGAIAAVDPNFTGLEAISQRAEQYQTFNQSYEDALRFYEQGKYLSAIQLLEEIQATEPNFKDVSARLGEIKRQALLADGFSKAEEAYQARNWKEAAAAYESVRVSDPEYKHSWLKSACITLMKCRIWRLDSNKSRLTLKRLLGIFQ
jgi:tetratricopeptide (TPR) repeat protein